MTCPLPSVRTFGNFSTVAYRTKSGLPLPVVSEVSLAQDNLQLEVISLRIMNREQTRLIESLTARIAELTGGSTLENCS